MAVNSSISKSIIMKMLGKDEDTKAYLDDYIVLATYVIREYIRKDTEDVAEDEGDFDDFWITRWVEKKCIFYVPREIEDAPVIKMRPYLESIRDPTDSFALELCLSPEWSGQKTIPMLVGARLINGKDEFVRLTSKEKFVPKMSEKWFGF